MSSPSVIVSLAPTRTIDIALVGVGGTLTIGSDPATLELLLSPIFRGPEGPPGSAGPGAGPIQTLLGAASGAVGGHRVVGPMHDGRYGYVDSTTLLDALRSVGVTTGAAADGDSVTVQTEGQLVEPSWTWIADLPIFVGANGTLTQAPPTAPARFILQVGFALSATTMFVRRRDPIYL